jgi:hypothetical protein
VPTLLGQQLFPADYPWNENISNAPVAANSANIIAHIGGSIGLHPDWGADNPANVGDPLYGIPFNVVHGNSTTKVHVVIDNYPGESDSQDVPIPAGAVIEGDLQNGPNTNGPGYNTGQRGDSHLIVWDEDNNVAYELFGVSRPSDPNLFPDTSGVEHPRTDTAWHAAQETVWDMKTDTFRTLGATSADAAGLSILAGLVRPDEGLTAAQGGQGAITHALRMTLPAGDLDPSYIYPASHMVGVSGGPDNLPLGSRLRLANTPAVNTLIANMPPESQIIARAMQQYGLIVADVGSAMYVTGASASVNVNNAISQTWDMNDIFASNGLEVLTAGDFEVVNLQPVVTGLSASSSAPDSTITVTGQNFSGAAGHISVLFGTTPSTSVTVVSDTQLSVLVPSGSGTVDVTVQSGVSETDTISDNPNANVNAPIFGYGTSATSSADRFTFSSFVPVSVSGTVFNDLNGNGTQQSGESGLQGWTVQLVNGSGTVVGSATTDTNGNYTISNVGSGTFTLREVLQSGFALTGPAAPGTYTITPTSGTNITGKNFGDMVFVPVSVSGTVFNDLNGNGTRQTGEPGLQGWTVQLVDSNSTVVGSATTNASGNYTISNVGSGTFTLREVLQSGFTRTAPGAPGTYTFTTTSGTNITGDNFGDMVTPVPPPPVAPPPVAPPVAPPVVSPPVERFTTTGPGNGLDVFDHGQAMVSGAHLYPGFTGRLATAVGDVNGDGVLDIATVVASGGPAEVKVFNGATGALLLDFDAFPAGYTGGASIALGDLDGTGKDDIIVGTITGVSAVAVFDGRTGALRSEFLAYPEAPVGVQVSAGDISGTGKAQILTIPVSIAPVVRVYNADGTLASQFTAFSPALPATGFTIGSGDLTGSGRASILVGASLGGADYALVFNGNGSLRQGLQLPGTPTVGAPASGPQLMVADLGAFGPRDLVFVVGDTLGAFDGTTLTLIGAVPLF